MLLDSVEYYTVAGPCPPCPSRRPWQPAQTARESRSAIQRAFRAPAITSRRRTPSVRSCQSAGDRPGRRQPLRHGGQRPWRQTLRRRTERRRLRFVVTGRHKWSNNRCGGSPFYRWERRGSDRGQNLTRDSVRPRIIAAWSYSWLRIIWSVVYNLVQFSCNLQSINGRKTREAARAPGEVMSLLSQLYDWF